MGELSTSVALVIVVLAVGLHLIVVLSGYRFHLFLLDQTSTTSSWSSWWKKHHDAAIRACDNNLTPTNLSDPQFAFLLTLGFWLLVVGLILHWRPVILIVILVGLILLMQQFPNDGTIPQHQIYSVVLGYITWLALLVSTVALVLWPCQSQFDGIMTILTGGGGGEGEGVDAEYYQSVAIGGTISSFVVGALALIAYCIERRNQSATTATTTTPRDNNNHRNNNQDTTGNCNCMETSLV